MSLLAHHHKWELLLAQLRLLPWRNSFFCGASSIFFGASRGISTMLMWYHIWILINNLCHIMYKVGHPLFYFIFLLTTPQVRHAIFYPLESHVLSTINTSWIPRETYLAHLPFFGAFLLIDQTQVPFILSWRNIRLLDALFSRPNSFGATSSISTCTIIQPYLRHPDSTLLTLLSLGTT